MMADLPEESDDQGGWMTEEMQEDEFRSRWPHPIPQQGDKFFQTDKDPDRESLDVLAASTIRTQGYEMAAAILFDEIQKSAERAGVIPEHPQSSTISSEHWLVYPMYFLYRHAIELSLKGLLAQSNNTNPNIIRCHDLKELWEMLKSWAQKQLPDSMAKSQATFEAMLGEIKKHDPDGQGGRYHLITNPNNRKDKNFPVFANITPLSAKSIRDASIAMLNFLQHIRSYSQEPQENQDNRN